MLIRILSLCLISLGLVSTSCSSNILDEFAKKDTNEALLFEAKKDMNDSEWTAAIAKFADMSSDFLAQRDVKLQNAKAYAGRCGLDLLQLFEDLSTNLSTGRLYALLMAGFVGGTATQADDCATAEGLIVSIAASAGSRTSEENTTLAFVSFAKMGATFAAFADDTLSDGSTDADFNGCQDNLTPGMPDAYVREVGIGLAIASTSLTAAIASGGLSGGGELSSATSACTALEALGAQYNFCTETDTASLTADQVKAIRWTMMDNQSVGLGGASACDLSNASCPIACP